MMKKEEENKGVGEDCDDVAFQDEEEEEDIPEESCTLQNSLSI